MNPEVAGAALIALVLAAACVGVGGYLVVRSRAVSNPDEALRLLPVAAALGFAVWSYGAYLLIVWGPPRRWVIVTLMVAAIWLGRRFFSLVGTAVCRHIGPMVRSLWRPVPLLCVLLSLGFLALTAMTWLTPVKEGDALRGYMFSARWLAQHGFALSPYNTVYFLYPLNTEVIFALSYPFGTDLVGKTLDGWLGVLLLVAVYEFASRYAGRLASFFVAISLGMVTEFAISWGTGKVEALCTFTFFAAWSLLLRQRNPSTSVIAMSAFLAGTSCAQKYTVWVWVPSFLASVWLVQPDRSFKRALQPVVLAGSIIAACVVPHLTKNLLLTGNPIAPFAQNLFPSPIAYLNPLDVSDATRTGVSDITRLPVTLFFDPQAKRFPGPFPLALLLGGLTFVLVRTRPPGAGTVAMIAAIQVGCWIALRRGEWLAPRFLLIPMALSLVVSAVGLDWLLRHGRLLRMTLTAGMLALIAWSGVWQNRHFRVSWPFVVGLESREAWQDRVVPGRGYSALHGMAPKLGPTRRLFTDTSLYNLPVDKIAFLNTEKELLEFSALPESRQLAYLQERCFGFYYLFLAERVVPAWSKSLPVVAEYKDRDPYALQFRLLKVDLSSSVGCAVTSVD